MKWLALVLLCAACGGDGGSTPADNCTMVVCAAGTYTFCHSGAQNCRYVADAIYPCNSCADCSSAEAEVSVWCNAGGATNGTNGATNGTNGATNGTNGATNGTNGTTTGTSTGTTTGAQTCDQCLSNADSAAGPCGNEVLTCDNDLTCFDLDECIRGCSNDAICEDDCQSMYGDALSEYQAMVTCEWNACTTLCGSC